MARKKSKSASDDGSVLIILIALALLYLVFIASFFVAIIAIITAFVMTQYISAEPPSLPNWEDFDDQSETELVSKIYKDLERLDEQIEVQYNKGKDAGISLTKASDYKQFDGRSRLGRNLNNEINRLDALIGDLELRMSFIAMSLLEKIPDIYQDFYMWRKYASFIRAVKQSVLVSLLISATFANFVYKPGWVISDFFEKATSFTGLHGPISIFPPLFGLSFFILVAVNYIRAKEKFLNDYHLIDNVRRWIATREKWSSAPNHPDFNQIHGDNDYILEPENDWRSILRVTETASIHEVKISYRNLMKKHHPDLAINLDHNKREKAAELAQKINAAYADAKRELDFQ